MATTQGIVMEDISASIWPGQRVYDVDGNKGNKIGSVDNYDTTNGWILVEKGTFGSVGSCRGV